MFGRRKRKPQDEDDPLVPHGLIWQATDEPSEPAEIDSAAAKYSNELVNFALPQEDRTQSPVVAPSQIANVQQPRPTPADSGPTKLGAISPPIPWPSPRTASVIRRMPPPTTVLVVQGATAPKVAVPQRPPQPTLPDVPFAQPRNEVEIVDLTITAEPAQSSRRRKAMIRFLQSLRQGVGNSRDVVIKFLSQVRGTAWNAYQSIDLQARLHNLKVAAEKSGGDLTSRSRLAGQSFQQWCGSTGLRLLRMKSTFGRFSSGAIRNSAERSADFARRIRSHRFRIRIQKTARAYELIQQSRLAWAAQQEAIRREPRFWTSLAMAVLSALLTLGVISAVSHYAPGADASNKAVANPPSRDSIVINPTVVVGPGTAARTPKASAAASVRSVAKPSPSQENGAQKTATRPAHRDPDDDYVAPNTYHYYGPNGKPANR